MAGFLAHGNGEDQIILAIHSVNSVHRFMGVCFESKEKTMKSSIKCIPI